MKRAAAIFISLLLAATLATGQTAASAAHATKPTTIIVSINSREGQANGQSLGKPDISSGGRFVAFTSQATNLVARDTNNATDVFVRDVKRGRTYRVSVSSRGKQANGESFDPAISGNGRYVVFGSLATNLVRKDTNEVEDIFLHDLKTRTTKRVSVSATGRQTRGGGSFNPGISADGRFIGFASWAENLVQNDTNQASDIFVKNRRSGSIERVNLAKGGGQEVPGDCVTGFSSPVSLSAHGRRVAFDSCGINLLPTGLDEESSGIQDVYVRDRRNNRTIRISVDNSGHSAGSGSGAESISANGRYVVFGSRPGLVEGGSELYVRDLVLSRTEAVPVDVAQVNGSFFDISGRGRYVVYSGDEHAFLRDRDLGRTTKVSVTFSGGLANGESGRVTISRNGRYVAYYSAASNLTPGDSNREVDIFRSGLFPSDRSKAS